MEFFHSTCKVFPLKTVRERDFQDHWATQKARQALLKEDEKALACALLKARFNTSNQELVSAVKALDGLLVLEGLTPPELDHPFLDLCLYALVDEQVPGNPPQETPEQQYQRVAGEAAKVMRDVGAVIKRETGGDAAVGGLGELYATQVSSLCCPRTVPAHRWPRFLVFTDELLAKRHAHVWPCAQLQGAVYQGGGSGAATSSRAGGGGAATSSGAGGGGAGQAHHPSKRRRRDNEVQRHASCSSCLQAPLLPKPTALRPCGFRHVFPLCRSPHCTRWAGPA